MPIKSPLEQSKYSTPVHRFTGQEEKPGCALFTRGYRRESFATSWKATSMSISLVNCTLMKQWDSLSTDTPRNIYLVSVFVNQIHFDQSPAQPELADNADRERLGSSLWTAFETEALEDGIDHPADEIIEKSLQSGNQSVLGWLRSLCLDIEEPIFAASVLRCLGRQELPGTDSWRTELVRDGLAANNAEMRDATVQAAESWGGQEILNILESHQEPEQWIQDYIRNVVNDLRE